jgi:hypothetical protein
VSEIIHLPIVPQPASPPGAEIRFPYGEPGDTLRLGGLNGRYRILGVTTTRYDDGFWAWRVECDRIGPATGSPPPAP